ncbi:hypothetical protein QUF55_06755 [Clostridiaceae bacterium HSG29]|nr:hypothetical protein [Clostridiaceae bacterium HSG29]
MTITIKSLMEGKLIYLKDDGNAMTLKEALNDTRKCMKMIDSHDKDINLIFDRRTDKNDYAKEIDEIIDEFNDFVIDRCNKVVTLCNCELKKKQYNYRHYKNRKNIKTRAFTHEEIEKVKEFLNINNNLLQ